MQKQAVILLLLVGAIAPTTVGIATGQTQSAELTQIKAAALDDDLADRQFGDDYNELAGTVIWAGQEFELEVSGTDTVAVYEYSRNSSATLRSQEAVTDGSIIVDTDGFSSEEYFLVGGDIAHDGNPVTRQNVTVEETFTVASQSLETTFGRDTVTDEGSLSEDEDFEIRSNRGSYPITVHAQGDLEAEELASVFEDDFVIFYRAEDDAGISDYDEIGIAVENSAGVTDGTYTLDFAGIDAGEYEFSFVGTDTGVTGTANTQLMDADPNVNFNTSTRNETVDDQEGVNSSENNQENKSINRSTEQGAEVNNNVTSDNITGSEPATPDEQESESDTETTVPGFGIVGALISLSGVGYLLKRKLTLNSK